MSTRYGLARVLSKRGLCSRSEAERRIRAGEVTVAGRVVRDPEAPTRLDQTDIVLADVPAACAARRYLILNKPRGLVTSARDEQGRDTVYRCFDGHELPWVAPAGRLDQASEGLLLFSNDPVWNAAITEPRTPLHKTYHVQIGAIPDPEHLQQLQQGIVDQGERLRVVSADLLRHGQRNAWLQIVLDEGRNRHIRRLLQAQQWSVLRLIRVAIGPIHLGELGEGQFRDLTEAERSALAAL